jgi:signal peptidase I
MALSLAGELLTPLPMIPGTIAGIAVLLAGLVFACWMLVRSFRPVPTMCVAAWLGFVVLACVLGVVEWTVGNQFCRVFQHPTSSMLPTLVPGDRLIVQTSAYWLARPKRGDMVVFKTDCKASLPKGQFWVKRVAALPGELIGIQQGYLALDDKRLLEPAILATNIFFPPSKTLLPDGTIGFLMPRNCYYVVGDNATNSRDSRDFGPIPRRSIVGKVTKVYWPPFRTGDVK